MSNQDKIIKIYELLSKNYDELVSRFFNTESEKMLDEKIEVLQALNDGKSPSEIPNYYKILELYPKENNINWD